MFKRFCDSTSEEVGLYWWRADGDFIHPCPLQLFLTLRTHARRTIGAPLQNLRRPKLSMTSFEAIWNQSRPTSPSIPTPRCCCFPTNIHQNCHLTRKPIATPVSSHSLHSSFYPEFTTYPTDIANFPACGGVQRGHLLPAQLGQLLLRKGNLKKMSPEGEQLGGTMEPG